MPPPYVKQVTEGARLYNRVNIGHFHISLIKRSWEKSSSSYQSMWLIKVNIKNNNNNNNNNNK